jgi:hypothetical protein
MALAIRPFSRHFAEMILAMLLGMGVLWVALELALSPLGGSLSDAPIAARAGVMAINMTIPMVAWMHFGRRMAVARCAEMAASMMVPTFAAVLLFWLGVIAPDAVMIIQHVVMIPAMLAVMLWRREAYSH